MIEKAILDSVKEYFSRLDKQISYVINKGEHENKEELLEFLRDIASCSDKVQLKEKNLDYRSPLSFGIYADEQPTGIIFSGIPSGHEFSSLILATMQAGGVSLNIDQSVQSIIQNIKEELHFEVFVSLTCQNCPDTVQALNQFALLNEKITTETINGELFKDEIEKRNILGVPAVFLNNERFSDGKIDATALARKLIEKFPYLSQVQNSTETKNLALQDVSIIGAGPAGVAAAVYCARKGLKVSVITKEIGGQIKDTSAIENLIGTIQISGEKLIANLASHMAVNNVNLISNTSIKKIIPNANDKEHLLILENDQEIRTKTLIIATGAKWRNLNVPGEKEFIGRGIAFCPHCDGPFFQGREIAVVGGGNSGIEAAIDLAGICKKVTVIEFADQLKADNVLINIAKQKENIEIFTNSAVEEIINDGQKVTGIKFKNRANNNVETVNLSGVFVQIGLSANTDFADGIVNRNNLGEIEINQYCQTSQNGVFAAGDCTTVPYKQVVIAMGEGAKAALSAFNYLMQNKANS